MSGRILVIDDDERLRGLLSEYFVANGFAVEGAATAAMGVDAFERGAFDLIVLDVMLPDGSGLDVCRRLRSSSNVPIVMLTAKGDETDRVVGLEIGADDYLPKPFSPRELLARIRSVLRRARPKAVDERYVAGEVVVDVGRRTAVVRGEDIELTAAEFDILLALAKRPGRVVTREGLLAAAGRDDVVVSRRTVDVHISHLRQKLGVAGDGAPTIRAVRGAGYMLVTGE